MKILQIGAGGIGSYLAKEVIECVEQEQIDSMIDYTIADDDMVEVNQITYQNFLFSDAGKNKAEVLAKRLLVFQDGIPWLNSSKKKIVDEKQLRGYNIIILCVDNNTVRRLVIDYCFKHNVEFLDLRAQGHNIFCMPKIVKSITFIDNDNKTYSCQEQADLKKGHIQKGNKIAATIGVQMLLNLLRGHTNRAINLVI
jgi:tRNA A37 threonylcarbamoyladenosine dehydratase